MKVAKKLSLNIIEAALFTQNKPMSIEKIRKLLPNDARPALGEVRELVEELQKRYQKRGVELVEVASGFRFQVAQEVTEFLVETQEEKPLRLTKAFLETLALVAYRQPITRGEIEDIRGVAVSSNIIKGLLELEWIREVGHKDVPGKPALFATTKHFLDYFNLKSLEDLPPLAELEILSETRLKEEFDHLNDKLKEELGSPEALMEAQKEQSMQLSPDFVGPVLPFVPPQQAEDTQDSTETLEAEFDVEDSQESSAQTPDFTAEESTSAEVHSEHDLFEEDSLEALDASLQATEQDDEQIEPFQAFDENESQEQAFVEEPEVNEVESVDVHESLAQTQEQNTDEPDFVSPDNEVAASAQAPETVDLEARKDQRFKSIFENLRAQVDEPPTFVDEADIQSQNPEALTSEYDDSECEVKIDAESSNHRDLSEFSNIILEGPTDVDDDDEDSNQPQTKPDE